MARSDTARGFTETPRPLMNSPEMFSFFGGGSSMTEDSMGKEERKIVNVSES